MRKGVVAALLAAGVAVLATAAFGSTKAPTGASSASNAGNALVKRGKTRTIIGLVGDTAAFMAMPLETLPGVENVIQVGKPYKLVARETHLHPSMVKIGSAAVGREQFSVIAGPCAIESADQSLESARAAKAAGATILRGDAYKARTSPYAFQGTTKIGLEILAICRATAIEFTRSSISQSRARRAARSGGATPIPMIRRCAPPPFTAARSGRERRVSWR